MGIITAHLEHNEAALAALRAPEARERAVRHLAGAYQHADKIATTRALIQARKAEMGYVSALPEQSVDTDMAWAWFAAGVISSAIMILLAWVAIG